LNFLALDENFSRIGGVVAEEDVHQGGLTGPVLTQQSADLSSIESKINLLVCDYIEETLLDGTHFRYGSWFVV
jgi:hypothetical protein